MIGGAAAGCCIGKLIRQSAMTFRCAVGCSRSNVSARGSKTHLRRAARGFTLLEVLVSIVVLSFGVLGVVGLQAASMQANKEARYQSSGVRLARELADLMRGNKVTAIKTTAGTTVGANPYLVEDFPAKTSIPNAAKNCVTSSALCNPTEIANFQMNDWLNRVNAELPGARVIVCFDDTPYASGFPQWPCGAGTFGIIVVKIGWSRQSTNRSATAASAVELASSATPLVVLPVTPGLP